MGQVEIARILSSFAGQVRGDQREKCERPYIKKFLQKATFGDI